MSVSGVTICSVQCDTSLSHRVDWIVECRPTPVQWLCEVAGYWQELEHAVAHADPEYRPHQGQDPDPEHAT